jgi:hypothetical protein
MQVLLRKSNEKDDKQDVKCSVCGQGFRAYWERTSQTERDAMLTVIHDELRMQHVDDSTASAHTASPFNVPKWQGPAQFSGAAMLGGLSTIRRAAPAELDFTFKR